MRALAAANGPLLMLDAESLLDIGSCVIDGVDIAPGKAVPDDGDPRIHRALEGFMFTCGPDHIRHPVPVPGHPDGALYPLHGSFSSHPAEILSVTEDDAGAVAIATVDVRLADGGEVRLERHWHIDGVSGEVSLCDRVINTGKQPFPVFMMYHINIAGRLLEPDTRIEGGMLEGGGFPWRFGPDNSGVFCVPARDRANGMASVSLGPIAALDNRSLTVTFSTDTLPFLQVWRNQKSPCDVIGIEPVSHRLARRAELEEAGEFDILSPGEGRHYHLSFRIS